MQARKPCEAFRVVAALAVLSLNAAQYPRLPLRTASPVKGLVRLSGAAAPELPLPAALGFLLQGACCRDQGQCQMFDTAN